MRPEIEQSRSTATRSNAVGSSSSRAAEAVSPEEARQACRAAGGDLAQVRPELGHATNAIARRAARADPRFLFFDRRAFLTVLTTHTVTTPDGVILAANDGRGLPGLRRHQPRVLLLARRFAWLRLRHQTCRTTSLRCLGVMDGDERLRLSGLPWQMVEIHEPVRLLIVCETTPAVMKKIIEEPAGEGDDGQRLGASRGAVAGLR